MTTGQNGATWQDPDGALLGVEDLQRIHLTGSAPAFMGSGPNFDPEAAEEWMPYFEHCSVGGVAWRTNSFVPALEGRSVLESRPLIRSAAGAHPDLSAINTSIIDLDGVPAAAFGTDHPYATGIAIDDSSGTRQRVEMGQAVALDDPPGVNSWRISVEMRFGTLDASRLTYVVRTL